MKQEHKAMFMVILGNSIWGFSFMFSKIALSYASPITAAAIRFLVAVAVMSLMLLFGGARLNLRGKKLGPLLLLGFCEPVIYFLCESYGILYTSATFSGVMIAMIPIASLFMSVLVLRESPTKKQVFFSVLSVVGVIVVTVGPGGKGVVTPKGFLLMLGAVFSAVGFFLLSRRSSGDFSPFERTYFMFSEGAVVYTLLALLENARNLSALVTPLGEPAFLASMFFLGVLSSVLAYFCLNYGSTYLPVTRTAAFTNLTTIISLFAGIIFLREPFGLSMIPAAVMIVVGVWGVQRFTRENEAADKAKKED